MNTSLKISSLLKFLIPSAIGIFLFVIPISYQGKISIPVALLAKSIEGYINEAILFIMIIVTLFSVLGAFIAKLMKPSYMTSSNYLSSLFDIHWFWVITRIIGTIFTFLILFEMGPEWIWSEDTGAILLYDLVPLLFAVFLFAGFFLPLLLNFGLLEWSGTLLNKVMRPLFRLPGRSSIDALASWLGDGTIGVLLTNRQYEEGFYTKREAAIISTTFSIVSITFSIVVLTQMGLDHLFLPYYLTITIAGFVAAIIMPRIPPLSRKTDAFYEGVKPNLELEKPAQINSFHWGVILATKRADQNKGLLPLLKSGLQNTLDMWLGVIPIVMALGTTALIVANNTNFFSYLGIPFLPLLTWMQVPEAAAAAETILIGFADMFLPAIIGSSIESEFTRFVIASLSVTQLIYMSETGGLLLASKLPVHFRDLITIFILRTLITLPVIVLMAHIIF